jgi:L-alanine-DL-glutamate epimerase-like enolase superfamily enzyme
MDDIYNLGKEVVKRGFTALKTNIMLTGESDHFTRAPIRENVEALQKIVGAFREAVGDKVDISLDLNASFNNHGFISVARAMEPFDLLWLEVDSSDPAALLQMKESARIPICSGGTLCTSKAFNPFLTNRAMDIAMIEVAGCGFTESRRIAALADVHEIMITPYNALSHLSTFMCAHVCASVPNIKIMGMDVDGVPWKDYIVTEIPTIKDGFLQIPRKPGIGVELNEKEIAKHPWPGRR